MVILDRLDLLDKKEILALPAYPGWQALKGKKERQDRLEKRVLQAFLDRKVLLGYIFFLKFLININRANYYEEFIM